MVHLIMGIKTCRGYTNHERTKYHNEIEMVDTVHDLYIHCITTSSYVHVDIHHGIYTPTQMITLICCVCTTLFNVEYVQFGGTLVKLFRCTWFFPRWNNLYNGTSYVNFSGRGEGQGSREPQSQDLKCILRKGKDRQHESIFRISTNGISLTGLNSSLPISSLIWVLDVGSLSTHPALKGVVNSGWLLTWGGGQSRYICVGGVPGEGEKLKGGEE